MFVWCRSYPVGRCFSESLTGSHSSQCLLVPALLCLEGVFTRSPVYTLTSPKRPPTSLASPLSSSVLLDLSTWMSGGSLG